MKAFRTYHLALRVFGTLAFLSLATVAHSADRVDEAVLRAISALASGESALRGATPHEMVLLDLYAALSALNELTGEITTEDILGRIFSTFCIGK